MTLPLIITRVVVIGFIAWAIHLSRRQSATKKEAIANLQEEQDRFPAFDIHALVRAEVEDLQLREITGAAEVPDSVLLKAWNESQDVVRGCPSRDLLAFVVSDGVESSAALDADVTLICTDMTSPVIEDEEPAPEQVAEEAPDLE